MLHITLTEEQALTVKKAGESVEVHDPNGQIVGFLQPLDEHEVEAVLRMRQRRVSPSSEPAIPSARVRTMLSKFEEIDRREGMTQEKAEEILARIRRGEEP
ncbi:MAG: hypothetical protein JO112_21280 [Planctomycetes bacterium]|nr:hypothetical protein [Planctomycetota bacterium]